MGRKGKDKDSYCQVVFPQLFITSFCSLPLIPTLGADHCLKPLPLHLRPRLIKTFIEPPAFFPETMFSSQLTDTYRAIRPVSRRQNHKKEQQTHIFLLPSINHT